MWAPVSMEEARFCSYKANNWKIGIKEIPCPQFNSDSLYGIFLFQEKDFRRCEPL